MNHGDMQRNPAAKPVQDRALETRRKIAYGAIDVLAQGGVASLTHRAVAKAAGVSLAATTYHFDKLADILAAASQTLMDNYLESFLRLQTRLQAGESTWLQTPQDLVMRLVRTAIVRERVHSLAWCEIILHAGRSEEGKALAQGWFARLELIWLDILRRLDPHYSAVDARMTIDRVIGLTFMLHPLAPDAAMVANLLNGQLDISAIAPAPAHSRQNEPHGENHRHEAARERLIQAAIDILTIEGASAISYGAVARRVGMARSGPSYYFPTMNSLLETSQIVMFEQAKARYKAGLNAPAGGDLKEADQLARLTAGIFRNEAGAYARQSIGYFSGWLFAAQTPALRAGVLSALIDQHDAWKRRFMQVSGAEASSTLSQVSLFMQADFIGKLVRYLATGTKADDVQALTHDFSVSIQSSIEILLKSLSKL